MSQKTQPEIGILGLDAERIGNTLVRLGLLSHQLAHKHIRGTLQPYCNHPENLSPEARFVYDMFTRTTPEIIDRWYGGEDGAIDIIAWEAGRFAEPAGSERDETLAR